MAPLPVSPPWGLPVPPLSGTQDQHSPGFLQHGPNGLERSKWMLRKNPKGTNRHKIYGCHRPGVLFLHDSRVSEGRQTLSIHVAPGGLSLRNPS